MDIKPISPGTPWANANGAEKPADVNATSNAANEAPATASTGIPANFTRADLHSEKQAGIVRDSLHALLNRAADAMGSLPDAARAQALAFLAQDPYLSSRVIGYLNQKAK